MAGGNKFDATSMSLFPGYLLPTRQGQTVSEIVAKISATKSVDSECQNEADLLQELSGRAGFPAVVHRGQAAVRYDDRPSFLSATKNVSRQAPFFIMPRIGGLDLDLFRLKQSDPAEASRKKLALITGQLMPALADRVVELHERNIVHRDIKPNNVLYDPAANILTVLDFGRAARLDAVEARTDHGAFPYVPPELMLETPDREDVRVDVFGFGATYYTLLTGRLGLEYEGVGNIWRLTGLDLMFISQEEVVKRFCREQLQLGTLGYAALVERIKMPNELKQSELGKYLVRLVHPIKTERPASMGEVAETIKRLGAQFNQGSSL
ncbi:MAG: protein kinase [Desulfobaccales bacterium]